MVHRRNFLLAAVLAALAPRCVLAESRLEKVGVLAPRAIERSLYAPAFVARLRELGYPVHYRSSEGVAGRYPRLVQELLAERCELFVALASEEPLRAMRNARVHAPVVFLAADYDPVERGFISTMRNPDGNRTGVFIPQAQLAVKRLQFLREALPEARSLLLLADGYSRGQIEAVRRAAENTRVDLTVVEFVKRPYDYAGAIDAGLRAEVQGLLALSSPVFFDDAPALAALCVRRGLPSAGAAAKLAEEGFLLSLGANAGRVGRRVADIGARILAGTRASDIAVEQADEFELVVNQAAARAMGRSLPEPVLARADRVVS